MMLEYNLSKQDSALGHNQPREEHQLQEQNQPDETKFTSGAAFDSLMMQADMGVVCSCLPFSLFKLTSHAATLAD